MMDLEGKQDPPKPPQHTHTLFQFSYAGTSTDKPTQPSKKATTLHDKKFNMLDQEGKKKRAKNLAPI